MSRSHTPWESAYLGRVKRLRCVICELMGMEQRGPTEAHHVYKGVGLSQRNSDFMTAALCKEHHQGATGIGGLGTRGFYLRYGVNEIYCVAQTVEGVFRTIFRELGET